MLIIGPWQVKGVGGSSKVLEVKTVYFWRQIALHLEVAIAYTFQLHGKNSLLLTYNMSKYIHFLANGRQLI